MEAVARLIDRIAILIAFAGIVVGLASGNAVLGGLMFWGSLVAWLLVRQFVEEYADEKRDDESEG